MSNSKTTEQMSKATKTTTGIDIEELKTIKVPFQVRRIGKKMKLTITGFSQNDPLGVSGVHTVLNFGNFPCVYFKGGGWLLLQDFIKHYELVKP